MPDKRPSRRTVLRSAVLGPTTLFGGCSALTGESQSAALPDATPGPEDWPAQGYDARNSRYNGDTAPPRSEPDVRWSRDFEHCYAPFVRGDRVVLNANDHVTCLRSTDGKVHWRSESEPWGFETPTLGAERAYVTGVDCVFGVDLESGDETWHGDPCHGANTASGTVADGRLYLEYGGYFSALDATGRVTWACSHDAQGTPAVVGDTAYVATAFTAEAVDLTATAIEWPWEDRDDDEPAHASRDAATKWSVPAESRITGPRIYRSPAVSEDTVFATVEFEGSYGGQLRALDRETGEEQWRVSSPPEWHAGEATRDRPDPVGRPTAPVVTDDLVVTSLGDRVLRAFTHDGEEAWASEFDHSIIDVVGARDTIVATVHDRSVEQTAPGHAALAAVDRRSSDRLWERTFEDHVHGLAVAGGTIYVSVVTERRDDGNVDGMRLLALE